MTRTAKELAKVLSEIYQESFGGDSLEGFRISWGEMRELAGVGRLDSDYIRATNDHLAADNYAIAPFDKFLAFVAQTEMRNLRNATGRVLEQFMPSDVDFDEDDEIETDDDVDIDES